MDVLKGMVIAVVVVVLGALVLLGSGGLAVLLADRHYLRGKANGKCSRCGK